ncbi:hypothetical protein ONS95_001366 [Cadophora gregata]|uniref:uncharacterized protein n=1 Tax=Cadophora gregata TaxID=51156 RepID=UPI0026DB85E5|nr:uncharacterized protein ONS95_001366 [Cadophora gregata]KAK0110985.1 hypothetical protein ONS95_001366 [Cadophora gregata]KAK0112556.1 hypothetical protein ONS96_001791 [Cadophora gregata f. sp. sojae]
MHSSTFTIPSLLTILLLYVQVQGSDTSSQTILTSNNQTTFPPPSSPSPRKVAIIGSGLSGATAAYYLHDSTCEIQPIHITVFERSPQPGGRIKSVKYRGKTLEVGAPAVSTHDWCFLRAMRDVGLEPKKPDRAWKFRVKRTLGVWDGERLFDARAHEPLCMNWWELIVSVWREGRHAWLFRKVSHPMWWEVGRLVWRYGVEAARFQRAVVGDLDAWDGFGRDFYDWETHTFGDLGVEADKSGLDVRALGSAREYLRGLDVSERFLEEVVEPYARGRFARNLDSLRGIAAEMAYREFYARSVAVAEGNVRLVDRLITLSKADLKLNTSVKEIEPGKFKRFNLGIESSLPDSTVETRWEEFDAVIIATPLHLSGISFAESLNIHFETTASKTPLCERHITHLVSSHCLSPEFFNLPPGTRLPDTILTTANSSTNPEIFSVTLLDTLTRIDTTYCSPWDLEDCDMVVYEMIFRIVSSEAIDNQTLAEMVGSPTDYEFPFVHRQVWPYITPDESGSQLPTGKIEIVPGLFYTGRGEDIVASLEMSCRMGFNAGIKASNDLYDAWRKEARGTQIRG